jgi:GDPmannose 4,6-dehydratase
MPTRELLSRERFYLEVTIDLEARHLIFGALGQDGSYLAEQLSSDGKQVIGVIRNSSVIPTEYLNENINYVRGDIFDSTFVRSLLETYTPTHIYNLASASSVSESYLLPEISLKVNFEFVRTLIENIEKYRAKSGQEIFLLQASSSEMFGPDHQSPITESTSHDPRSPYAEHKSMAHMLCINARVDRGINIGTAILFNHESPRRPLKFVSRKITHGAYLISKGIEKKLILGNINLERDWGYAPEYVNAMKQIAYHSTSSDFVIATGKLHTIDEICQVAFGAFGIEYYKDFLESDSSYYRTNENTGLIGDFSKALSEFAWSPSVSFKEMVELMAKHESNED